GSLGQVPADAAARGGGGGRTREGGGVGVAVRGEVPGGQGGGGDHQTACAVRVRGLQAQVDPGQTAPVVDTASGGLRGAVGGAHRDPLGTGAGEHIVPGGRPAHQHGGEAAQHRPG